MSPPSPGDIGGVSLRTASLVKDVAEADPLLAIPRSYTTVLFITGRCPQLYRLQLRGMELSISCRDSINYFAKPVMPRIMTAKPVQALDWTRLCS